MRRLAFIFATIFVMTAVSARADIKPWFNTGETCSMIVPIVRTALALPEIKAIKEEMPDRRPAIAIIIDDVGVDHRYSPRAIKLPAKITLAFLPYADKIEKQVATAKQLGHEVMVHIPAEPLRRSADPGPDYLGAGMPEDEIHTRVLKNLDAFTGYDGVNNHMGSKFTQDVRGLTVLMEELKARHVFFVDSKTSPRSMAEETARAWGVDTTHRDVFLDDTEDRASVDRQLRQVERVARKTGSAVAIGHPKLNTLDALDAWLPTLEQKGFRLVDVREVIKLRNRKKTAAAYKYGLDAVSVAPVLVQPQVQ